MNVIHLYVYNHSSQNFLYLSKAITAASQQYHASSENNQLCHQKSKTYSKNIHVINCDANDKYKISNIITEYELLTVET